MNNKIQRLSVLGLALAATLATLNAPLSTAHAQGTAFTYQGRLNSGGGLANGSYDLAFKIYDTNQPAGMLIAGPLTYSDVAVSNGLFTVMLDFGADAFTGNARWLEIAVRTNGAGSFTLLSPRQQITPTPYAIMAASASNLLGALPTAQLTGTIPAGQLSGTIPSADVAGTYGSAVLFNNGEDTFNGTFIGQFFGSSFFGGSFNGQFFGDGGGLYDLNASQLTGGTVSDARLAPNVAFLNSNQTFTAQNVFQQPVGFGNPAPYFPVDVLANQAVGNFVTTNNGYGSVIVLQNQITNAGSFYLGAVNFNNVFDATPGQIGYVSNPTNENNDLMTFRVDYVGALALQADPSGKFVCSVIGDSAWNSVDPSSGGNVIAGGGYPYYGNAVYSNSFRVFIGAGYANQAGPNVYDAVIAGGGQNTVLSPDSVISGGFDHQILMAANYSTIGGGYYNFVAGDSLYSIYGYPVASTVGGGANNLIQTNSIWSFIGGGSGNTIEPYALGSVIAGGYGNSISGNSNNWANFQYNCATIAGGAGNNNGAAFAAIGGGRNNTIQTNAGASTIGGGAFNQTAATGAVVPGGFSNLAAGIQSFAAGTQAQATNDGAFVLADFHATNFYSTTSNQLSARFSGGVRFVTGGAGMTVDGQPVLAGSNGTGLTNVNAATFSGQPATAYAAASGSTGYIQNQNTGPQAASFNVSGSAVIGGAAQIGGLLRSGSETGTAEAPSPAGLVVRRINSTSTGQISNSVVAVSGALTLVRDGTYGGFQIKYPASPGFVTIACMGFDTNSVQKNFYTFLANPSSAGTVQIYSSGQNVVHFECTFGNTFNGNQPLTQVTLSRYYGDYFWSGNVISTSNQ